MLDLAHIARVAGLVQLVCALPAAINDLGPGLPAEGLAFGQPSITLERALQHIHSVLEQACGVLAPDIDALLQFLWSVPAALNDVNGASPEVVALIAEIDAIVRALIRQREVIHRQNVPGVMHGTARLLTVLQEVLRSVDRHAATFSSLASSTAQFGPFRAGMDGRRPIDDCRAWLAEHTAALQASIVEHEAGNEAVELLPSLQSDQEAAERSGIQIPFTFKQQFVRIKVPSLATLASGADGMVIRAFIQAGNAVERVALKLPRALASAAHRQLEALQREDKIWSGIEHPRILPYYGYCHLHGDQIAFVSPLMENGNMLQYLKANPSADRESLIRQVAEGLQYLHCVAKPEIVHGDVKCENVLISNEGTALLADFGLSTAVSQSVNDCTATTLRNRYTLAFAAPEIIADEAYNPDAPEKPRSKTTASDVYAYGMFIYQAYTGMPPYPGACGPRIIVMVKNGVLPSRGGQNALFIQSDALWNLCVQCWSRDAQLRPTMERILELLE